MERLNIGCNLENSLVWIWAEIFICNNQVSKGIKNGGISVYLDFAYVVTNMLISLFYMPFSASLLYICLFYID